MIIVKAIINIAATFLLILNLFVNNSYTGKNNIKRMNAPNNPYR
jgi:hypothetical protein